MLRHLFLCEIHFFCLLSLAPKGTDFPGLVSNGRPFFYNPVSDTLFGTVSILFSNGSEKMFDFSGELGNGICGKLRDMDYFKRFTIDPFTIDWNNEIGFDPEYLYEHGTL